MKKAKRAGYRAAYYTDKGMNDHKYKPGRQAAQYEDGWMDGYIDYITERKAKVKR